MQKFFETLDAEKFQENKLDLLSDFVKRREHRVTVNDLFRILSAFEKKQDKKKRQRKPKFNEFASKVTQILLPVSDGWLGAEIEKILQLFSCEGEKFLLLTCLFETQSGWTVSTTKIWRLFKNEETMLALSRYTMKRIGSQTLEYMSKYYFDVWKSNTPSMLQWCISSNKINMDNPNDATLKLSDVVKYIRSEITTTYEVIKLIKPFWKGIIDTETLLVHFKDIDPKSKTKIQLENLLASMQNVNTNINNKRPLSDEKDEKSASSSLASKRAKLESIVETELDDDSQLICSICEDKEISTVALPCGHSYACKGCALKLLPLSIASINNNNSTFNCSMCNQTCLDIIPLYIA